MIAPPVMSISAPASKVVFPSWSIQTVPIPLVTVSGIAGSNVPPKSSQVTVEQSGVTSRLHGTQGSKKKVSSIQSAAPVSVIVIVAALPEVIVKEKATTGPGTPIQVSGAVPVDSVMSNGPVPPVITPPTVYVPSSLQVADIVAVKSQIRQAPC